MSASSTEKIKPIAQIIRDFREHPEELTEDDRDIIVIALETVWDLMKYEKTANWKAQPAKPGYFTPGGNSVYECDACGYVYGAHEIFPSANICKKCGRLVMNGRRNA